MLDNDFFNSLPSDDIEAIILITEKYEKIPPEGKNIDLAIRTYIAIRELAKNVNMNVVDIEFVGPTGENLNRIRAYINIVFDEAKRIKINRILNDEEINFKSIRANSYEYEFKDDDFKRLQELINKLRELLQRSPEISENHRFRLLNRLEGLQKELHKRVSNLDRALGFLLDVSIIVKQTGEGAKPIADLAKEISKLITQVILISKGLPPGEIPPLLK
jgi:hypothetical protein